MNINNEHNEESEVENPAIKRVKERYETINRMKTIEVKVDTILQKMEKFEQLLK